MSIRMWVPNSERGPKIPSLGGEIEIPHIPFLSGINFTVTQFTVTEIILQLPK